MKTADSRTQRNFTLVSEGSPLQGVAAQGAVDPEPSPAEVDGSGPLALVLGELVANRYRVGPVIGAGGMGIVYKAQHVQLGTSVALKVIRPDIARNSSVWRRFSREARALAALHNKHVVRVHDAGTLDSGLRYLVMELLVGTDLRRLIQKEGPISVQRAVDYVSQVCSALGDAHRLNIIHRDIKPENIFLAQYRACEPTIKLLDFGVALFLDDVAPLTKPGRGVGSPQYLSPEQLQNPGAVDQRSDIWAVGLLMFELLAGHSPFQGLNTAQICLKIIQGSLPRIEDVCPTVPRELAQLIQRCLEVDPARRPQTADELCLALEPFSSRHVREARPEASFAGQSERTAQPRRRGFMPRFLNWATTASTAHRLHLSRLQAPPSVTERERSP
jgi:eukaryotic-like serine/threonine-protein kinase